MNRVLCLALLALALAMIPAGSAYACNGRGGLQRGYAGGNYGGGQFVNNMRMQQQMQQAYLMQQQALAIQKAQKAEAKHAVRLANAEKHRAEQVAAREAAKEKRGNSLK
jgi:hypothetical protein